MSQRTLVNAFYRKFFIGIVLTMSLVLSPVYSVRAKAGDEEYHDKFTITILFGEQGKVGLSQKGQNNIDAINKSVAVAIDQFDQKSGQNNDEEKLTKLKEKYGISGLPRSVSEITFVADPNTHRSYTHKGWNFHYGDDLAHWEKRKDMILKTVDQTIGFDPLIENTLDKLPFIEMEYDDRCDKFAMLVYDLHVLGDHYYKCENYLKNYKEDDPEGNKKRAKPDWQILGVGGRNDKNDIIDDIVDTIMPVLFEDQKDTGNYQRLKNKLTSMNKELKHYQEKDNMTDPEMYRKYSEYMITLKEDILMKYLPLLLKNETYFKDAFYDE